MQFDRSDTHWSFEALELENQLQLNLHACDQC